MEKPYLGCNVRVIGTDLSGKVMAEKYGDYGRLYVVELEQGGFQSFDEYALEVRVPKQEAGNG
jgi:hypothetical protein